MKIGSAVGGFFVGALVAVNMAPTKVETVTVEKRVEVPGPEVVREVRTPVADSCLRLYDLITEQHEAMMNYSHALAPQMENLNDAVQATITLDSTLINQVITTQNTVRNEGTGYLQTIIANETRLTSLHEQCQQDSESDNG